MTKKGYNATPNWQLRFYSPSSNLSAASPQINEDTSDKSTKVLLFSLWREKTEQVKFLPPSHTQTAQHLCQSQLHRFHILAVLHLISTALSTDLYSAASQSPLPFYLSRPFKLVATIFTHNSVSVKEDKITFCLLRCQNLQEKKKDLSSTLWSFFVFTQYFTMFSANNKLKWFYITLMANRTLWSKFLDFIR